MSEAKEAAPAASEAVKTSEPVSANKSEENGAGKAQADVKAESHNDEKRGYRPNNRTAHQERRDKYMSSSKNVRTDYAALPETDDPDEIRKQVEFYLSDSNLYYDDHMRERVLGNRDDQYGENNGVSIKEIHSFKRMKRFQPYSAVVAALKDSKTLDVVDDENNSNDALVRRKTALAKPPVDEDGGEFGDPTIPRAVYAKGFGDEGKTTQFDIEAFFTPYGPLNSVRLRRSFPDRIFKGSVFVEFESEELQQEFLAMDPKPKFEGRELLIKSKRQYCDEKMEDVKSGKIQSNRRQLNYKGYYHDSNRNGNRDYNHNRGHRGGGNRGGRGGRGGSGGRRDRDKNGSGGRDRDDWRGRRDDFQQKGSQQRNGNRRQSRDNDDDDANVDDAAAAAQKQQDKDDGGASKKREREDVEESEAKKAKIDDVAS